MTDQTEMKPEPDMDINGTCKHAVLAVTPEYMIGALGEPHTREGGYPTSMEWMFRDSLGNRWIIYDHKGAGKDGLLSLGGEYDMNVDSRVIREFVEKKLPNARLLWIADARGGMSYSLMEKYMEFLMTRHKH